MYSAQDGSIDISNCVAYPVQALRVYDLALALLPLLAKVHMHLHNHC